MNEKEIILYGLAITFDIEERQLAIRVTNEDKFKATLKDSKELESVMSKANMAMEELQSIVINYMEGK